MKMKIVDDLSEGGFGEIGSQNGVGWRTNEGWGDEEKYVHNAFEKCSFESEDRDRAYLEASKIVLKWG